MQINDKILYIPPYISTTWQNISSLTIDNKKNLVVLLHTKEKILIPNLDFPTLNLIFENHKKHLEQPNTTKIGFKLPIGLDGLGGLDPLSFAKHNPKEMNAENLPDEILEKLSSISKVLEIDQESLPKPEPHCNCTHCQIARAMRGEKKEEEIVSDEDLKFRIWDIEQTGDNLFQVKNPLDSQEHYDVFLGNPIGCTCGKKDCEHIKAVLKS